MNTSKALTEILEAVKPLTVTDRSRSAFVQDCSNCGIAMALDLKFSGIITEQKINNLIDYLSSAVLKLIVRNVLRNY